GLLLTAKAPGAWANGLRARVRLLHVQDPVTHADTTLPNVFNLMVRDGSTGSVETFLNVSIEAGSSRRVDRVLAAESALVTAAGAPGVLPPESSNPDNARGQFDPWADNAVAATATQPALPATNTAVA